MQGNAHDNYLNSYTVKMLRNVLEDYFGGIKDERDFDYPLISLLRAMGFYDIHFLHGGREIGKDFIARKIVDEVEYQYALQSKKGDIGQGEFPERQLMLASISGLGHPQFNKQLPRRVVLVSTGRLVGNAPLIFQDLNNELETTYQKEKVEFWGKDQLVPLFEEHGLTGIHQSTSKGFIGYAKFFLTYGKALDGDVSDREIENYSRLWLEESLEYRKRILRAAIETEIIATKLVGNGSFYEAITSYLGLARVVLSVMYENNDDYTVEVYKQIIEENILPLSKQFHDDLKMRWDSTSKKLLPLIGEKFAMPMLHYIVWCARILELSSLYYFLSKDKAEREQIISFILEFLEKEPGCGHIPSDKYATTVVWTTLALLHSENRDDAIKLVRRSAVWLCDRVERGFGIAHYEADEYEETATLIGYPFENVKIRKNRSSFLATILADLAALIGDREFYGEVVNDFEATEITYTYWQFPDTKSVCRIDTEECLAYPNIPHQYSLGNFEDFDYSEHIKHEPSSFQITQKAGVNSLMLLSILLKDRYFPKAWKQILSDNDVVVPAPKPKKSNAKRSKRSSRKAR
jgi:hypothetical protein